MRQQGTIRHYYHTYTWDISHAFLENIVIVHQYTSTSTLEVCIGLFPSTEGSFGRQRMHGWYHKYCIGYKLR